MKQEKVMIFNHLKVLVTVNNETAWSSVFKQNNFINAGI